MHTPVDNHATHNTALLIGWYSKRKTTQDDSEDGMGGKVREGIGLSRNQGGGGGASRLDVVSTL